MKRTIKKSLNILKGILVYLFFLLMYPFAKTFLFHKKIWIITERESEARDNGYVFFKYIRTNHPEINCYYAIKKGVSDYYKISELGNIIEFGSLKHSWYFCGAKYIVSTTIQAFCPNYFLTMLRRKIRLPGKYIYLKHGIIKDNLIQLYRNKTKFNLFICGAKPEYDYVKQNFNYRKKEVVYTGLARFDNYHNLPCSKNNKLLVMPTWRRSALNDNFTNSDYYFRWSSFLTNKKLIEILNDYKIELYFYPHPMFQKFSKHFYSNSKRIIICNYEKYDLQGLIQQSDCLITDYSSIAFDFAYMKKPILYYQYDADAFYKEHYIKGYFDYEKGGFGHICLNEGDLINQLSELCKREFKNDQLFLKRIELFYSIYDNKNCERIFKSITDKQQ